MADKRKLKPNTQIRYGKTVHAKDKPQHIDTPSHVPIIFDCDRLPDGLYQGAHPLQRPFFADAVVNLETQLVIDYSVSRLRGYLWAPIEDKALARPTVKWLDQIVDTLISWRKAGWCIFIHCKAGRSRSSLISIAYFMKAHAMTRNAALAMLRRYRRQATPNIGFMASLDDYAHHLRIPNS